MVKLMIVDYDKEADALYVRFSDKKYQESKEVSNGVILDLDRDNHLIGIEIINASKVLPKEALTKFTVELLSPIASKTHF